MPKMWCTYLRAHRVLEPLSPEQPRTTLLPPADRDYRVRESLSHFLGNTAYVCTTKVIPAQHEGDPRKTRGKSQKNQKNMKNIQKTSRPQTDASWCSHFFGGNARKRRGGHVSTCSTGRLSPRPEPHTFPDAQRRAYRSPSVQSLGQRHL